jgi:hypothetical protein
MYHGGGQIKEGLGVRSREQGVKGLGGVTIKRSLEEGKVTRMTRRRRELLEIAT